MKNYKLQLSEGFKDIYGKEMLIRKEIESISLDVFKHHGYEIIKTPQVEYIDVYSTDGVQKPDLYNLINRQGEVLALCNDMTSSIARFVASNNIEGLSKFSYIADTFRYPRLYQGKKHQFLQAGVEFIGYDGIEADAECRALYYTVSEYSPELGLWLYINTQRDQEMNDKIINVYYKYIELWGLKHRCGIYIEISRLSKISWSKFQDKFYLWGIDKSLDFKNVEGKLLQPSMFEVK